MRRLAGASAAPTSKPVIESAAALSSIHLRREGCIMSLKINKRASAAQTALGFEPTWARSFPNLVYLDRHRPIWGAAKLSVANRHQLWANCYFVLKTPCKNALEVICYPPFGV